MTLVCEEGPLMGDRIKVYKWSRYGHKDSEISAEVLKNELSLE